MENISFIGVGNMGSALIRGLVGSGMVSPGAITAFDIDSEKVMALERELGIVRVDSLTKAVPSGTDVVVLAVKPQIVSHVLKVVADRIDGSVLLVSIAAGVTTSQILSSLNGPARVIRSMPNAAAMVGRSATAVCKGGDADDADLKTAMELFSAVGTATAVEEKLINAVTGLSGSGPAYLFVMMEALVDGAVRAGMDRPSARELIVQTFLGAATMAAQGNLPFSELKDRITSPGGTTIAGLQVMERAGVRGTLMDVVETATRRADELAG